MSQPAPGTPWSWRLGLAAAVVGLATLAYLSQDTIGHQGQAAVGVFCFLGVALACSTNVRAISRRTVLTGILLQVFLAVMILKVEPVRKVFEWMGAVAKQFLAFSSKGGEFVFGPLV